jgi:hypothetical protein
VTLIYTLLIILFFNGNSVFCADRPPHSNEPGEAGSPTKRVWVDSREETRSPAKSDVPTEIETEEEDYQGEESWEHPEFLSIAEIIECIKSFDYETFFSENNRVRAIYLPLLEKLFKKTPQNKIAIKGIHHEAQNLLFNDIGLKDKGLIGYLHKTCKGAS